MIPFGSGEHSKAGTVLSAGSFVPQTVSAAGGCFDVLQGTSSAAPWLFGDSRDAPSRVRGCAGALHCSSGAVAIYLFRVAVGGQNKL